MNRLFEYIKNPLYCENVKPKVRHFFALIFIYILFVFPIGGLIFIISKVFHLEHYEPDLSPLNLILLGIIIVPIYEELVFRSLLKFKKNNLILFFSMLGGMIVYFVIESRIIPLIIASVLLAIVLLLLVIFSREKIEHFISSNFKYFFYASAILFGLLHASNFTGNVYIIMAFSFILGGPQIIMGLILGFIRMNYGLFYSILFHVMINSTLLFTFIK